MKVLVRDEGSRVQMTLHDDDGVKNFLFALPALKGAAMALAPRAASLLKGVAKTHASKVARAIMAERPQEETSEEEEELESEGYSVEDLAESWEAELDSEFDQTDPSGFHAYVSADGRSLELTLPYAQMLERADVLDVIDRAAREAGLAIAPGDHWREDMLPLGDVEVKHFMPVIAGIAGSLLGKKGILGKAFKGLKGLFGKKKKKRRRGRRSESTGGEPVAGPGGHTTSQGVPPQPSTLESILGAITTAFGPRVAQPSPAIGSTGPGGGVVMAAGSAPGSALSITEQKPMWGGAGTPWPVGPGAPPAPLGEPVRPVSMIQNVVSNTWTPAAPVSSRAVITPVPVNPTVPMHPERISITRSESDETVSYDVNASEYDYAGGQHYTRDGAWGDF